MADPAVYLEKLSAFSRIVRQEGLIVGPKETADAAEILVVLGLENRQQVKTALRTVYAKSREEQLIFDRAFDGFFISEEAMRSQAAVNAQKDFEIQQNIDQLKNSGQGTQLTREQQYIYGSMPPEARDKLRDFMDKYKQSAQRNPNLYDGFIRSVFTKALLEQQIKMEDAAVGAVATDPELGMLYRDLSLFQDTEIPKAISVIQTIARQINGELTAKRGKRAHSGKLDFRRTIRKGLETGGSFYRLCYRKKRNRRKSLVLLCDVSGSMMQFSEFALRFIQSLNQASEDSRVFLFSEEMYEADAFSLQNMDMFREYVRECGVYGKGTDLGAALRRLISMNPGVLSSATTLLILSDTKTVAQQEAVQALLEAKRLAGRTLILNPIPQSRWQYLSSSRAFSNACTMIPCSTLSELAAACRKLTLA